MGVRLWRAAMLGCGGLISTKRPGYALQSFFAGGPTKKGFPRPNGFIRAGLTRGSFQIVAVLCYPEKGMPYFHKPTYIFVSLQSK